MSTTFPAEIVGNGDLSPQSIGGLFQKAHATHVDSVRYLIQCGERLNHKRASLKRGEWLPWIETNRETLGFGERTAQLLIKSTAANPQLTSDLPAADALKINRQIWGNSAKTPRVACESSPRPRTSPVAHSASTLLAPGPEASPDPMPNAGDWEPDEEAAHEAMEKAHDRYVDKLVAADDKFAEAHKEVMRQAAEIGALKISRDGFMNGKGEMVRLLKKEQTKTARLQREIDRLKADNEALRERIAIMEEPA